MIEGVHFRHAWTGPRDLGHKALAVNLSDLAAMGCRPLAAFLALSVPPSVRLADLRAFFMGLRAEGRRWGCPLAGGDLTRAPQWVIALTVLGTPAHGGRTARRAAARPGQTLYVTGWPGESGAGLAALGRGLSAPRLIARHRRPTPRLPEAAALTRACPDLAMLDVSDGLWNDAAQLAEASGVRIELDGDRLPLSPPLRRFAEGQKADPRDFVLFGGEDYELLFATAKPLAALREALRRAGLTTPIHPVGRVAAGRGAHLLGPQGEIAPRDRTFRHFRT
jgi:thiamine-monophosphate kinase